MADMPGESQEEPSVMVVAILATIRLTSSTEMLSRLSQVAQGRSYRKPIPAPPTTHPIFLLKLSE